MRVSMGGRAAQESFLWVPDYDEQLYPPPVTNLKRKGRSKKIEFDGWASKPLIEFLQSIGKDTTQQISRYDVTDSINKYVNDNKLLHQVKKKRVVSDERLLSLFGKKSFLRIKIYDLLEAHYAENQFESDDDILFSSDDENNLISSEKQKCRKAPLKKICLETPKSCWAAIIPDNVKHIYLKRSLVQVLLKDPETFERKIVGSFVRVRSDPNDYLQKNSHQLMEVTGIKKVSATDDKNTEILLQVSNFVKDIRISTLSDDNFSEEECKDLCQRIKDGLLKRPTVVELEEKTLVLHEDITKHWLVGELALLQKLIDRANEKGWRKELWDYLERRQLLQTPAEQERLLHEVPKIITEDELEAGHSKEEELEAWHSCEEELGASPQECPGDMENGNNGSLIPNPKGAYEVPVYDTAVDGPPSSLLSLCTEPEGVEAALQKSEQLKEKENVTDAFVLEPQKQPVELVEIDGNEISGGGLVEPQPQPQPQLQVIDLSDDEEEKEGWNNESELLRRLDWHYADPQGDIQGPFSIASLKRWWDDDYFPPDFKVWKSHQGQENAVLLRHVLLGLFPS